ncbi:RNA-binding protein 28 [Sitophilus oryzae]|uniref:RNA-binding protein 28 n=1 Tax=Sitophilus oryzae TaxID=7048 RepID=A0A6J2XUD3_SITOR|nr:RNA-binding protein 28 [Sitophilus oryzae]
MKTKQDTLILTNKDGKKAKFSKFKKSKSRPFVDQKKAKDLLKHKRARLVVRNLSFKATEESIREHFQQYGEVTNVEVLKKPDGKLVGCAFVQFQLVQFARKAQHYTNNQPFLGRNIKVDIAKPKKLYKKQTTIDIKDEIKKEEVEIKSETLNENDILVKLENKPEDLDPEVDIDKSSLHSTTNDRRPFMSHDVSEGRTVFIKNVPFDATNEDLKNCLSQYGPIFYALVCIDKITEHSKGTAFVKFVNKEDAEKALTAGTELTLLGNVLDCHPALDRNDLKHKIQSEKDQKSRPRDTRNLYLVKEGVILAGTKAAEGVSQSDMTKRLQIEQYKTQMLRNLNTFVSRDRVVVHNLPATWDDRKLNMLFKKHGGKDAVVREARIMRNLRKLDANGIGESKQYGFVAFTKHENALEALRSLNNNPNIFSPQKRPIITFSIENKSALNAKTKRQQKSKLKNPKSKEFDPSLVQKDNTKLATESSSEVKPFAGITSKEGAVQKMRSRYKLNVQAKMHYENVKKEKKKNKMTKKPLSERRKDFTKQPKQKIVNKTKDDTFSKLVNDYRKILDNNVVKKSKWYE